MGGLVRTYDTVDEAFCYLAEDISESPQFVSEPRGQRIRETLAVTFRVRDPRSRVVWNPIRKANLGFMVGEFLWYWQGRQDLEMMTYYNKRMPAFSDDGVTLNSAYGHRLRKERGLRVGNRPPNPSQWEVCKKTLVDDPDSRRAVMLINRPHDELIAATEGSNDVPCTLALQFFIREKQLHLHVTMRSNDLFWGFTSDAFSFTLLQECMLLELREEEKFKDLELGEYYHTAGSMHIYERHFEDAKKVTPTDKILGRYVDTPMVPLRNLGEVEKLCRDEDRLRKGIIKDIDLNEYGYEASSVRFMANALNVHRFKRDEEMKHA
jgi:thymidylate synthase